MKPPIKYSFTVINNKTYSVTAIQLGKSVGLLVWSDSQSIWTYVAHHDTPHGMDILLHICRFVIKLNSRKSEFTLAN